MRAPPAAAGSFQGGPAIPCPTCAKRNLIAIAVTIGEHQVTMHSCSHCGARWWEREGQRVELPKVLELAAGNR